jgi:hypothetical protein
MGVFSELRKGIIFYKTSLFLLTFISNFDNEMLIFFSDGNSPRLLRIN